MGDNPAIRAIVLAANGPAFCAGADLGWMRAMASYSEEENRRDAKELARMLHTIWSCPKPVVARVHGDTYAGGMGLVAACDIAVVADTAKFCLSEARLGLLPATISPYVIRAMGQQAARRYFISAETFDAAEALRLGFAHVVVSSESLDDRVSEIVKELVANSPNAVRESKRLVQDVAGRAIDDGLLTETADRVANVRASDEGKEGVRAFLEKRTPRWRED